MDGLMLNKRLSIFHQIINDLYANHKLETKCDKQNFKVCSYLDEAQQAKLNENKPA